MCLILLCWWCCSRVCCSGSCAGADACCCWLHRHTIRPLTPLHSLCPLRLSMSAPVSASVSVLSQDIKTEYDLHAALAGTLSVFGETPSADLSLDTGFPLDEAAMDLLGGSGAGRGGGGGGGGAGGNKDQGDVKRFLNRRAPAGYLSLSPLCLFPLYVSAGLRPLLRPPGAPRQPPR